MLSHVFTPQQTQSKKERKKVPSYPMMLRSWYTLETCLSHSCVSGGLCYVALTQLKNIIFKTPQRPFK